MSSRENRARFRLFEQARAMPAPRTLGFTYCLLADIAFLMDASVRWHVGLGFLQNAEWCRTAAVMVLLFIVFNTVMMRFALPGWLQALCVVPLLVVTVVAGCSGSGLLDWHRAPVFSRILEQGWDDVLSTEDYRTPFSGALLHGLWGWLIRREVRRPSWSWPDALLASSGAGLLLLQRVAKAEIMVVYPDPRLALAGMQRLPELPPERASFWFGVGLVGVALLAAGAMLRMARLFWLYRVAKGGVAGISLRAATGDVAESCEGADAPTFSVLPFRKRRRLLVRQDERGEHVLARVLG